MKNNHELAPAITDSHRGIRNTVAFPLFRQRIHPPGAHIHDNPVAVISGPVLEVRQVVRDFCRHPYRISQASGHTDKTHDVQSSRICRGIDISGPWPRRRYLSHQGLYSTRFADSTSQCTPVNDGTHESCPNARARTDDKLSKNC